MTSQPGYQTITTHILPNVSRIKGHQTMKFRQLIEYSKIILFFFNQAEKEAGRLAPDRFLFFKKALYEVTASVLQLRFKLI